MPVVIEKVPATEVGEVVQSFITNDNTVKVVCTRQSDGKWKVEAET